MMPSFEVEDYRIVIERENSTLAQEVKKLLDEGWVLWGSPYVRGKYHSYMTQAMIKPKRPYTLNLTEEQAQDHFEDMNFTL